MNVSGHSKYLVFRFTLRPHGSEMHYKWFSDQPWLPAQTGLHLISVSCIWRDFYVMWPI